MKRHAFDPFSFVVGLAVTALGLYFLVGNRTAADIGATWIWPFPVLLVGLASVMYAVRRMRPDQDRVLDPDGQDPDIADQGSVDPMRSTHEAHED
jgi:hypothetical protein